MFQDSNKEYTGSGAGVAGGNPATPVSLTADQEAAVQAAALAALQQLKQRQTIASANMEAIRAQLYELARQTIVSQEGSLDTTKLVNQWEQKTPVKSTRVASDFTSSLAQRGETSPIATHGEDAASELGQAGRKQEAPSVKTAPFFEAVDGGSAKAETNTQPVEKTADGERVEDEGSDGVGVGAEQSGLEPQVRRSASGESDISNSERVDNEPQQSAATVQASAQGPTVDNPMKDSGDVAIPEASTLGQEANSSNMAPDGAVAAAGKSTSDETPSADRATGAALTASEPGTSAVVGSEAASASQAPVQPIGKQSPNNGTESEGGSTSLSGARESENGQSNGESGGSSQVKVGLPTNRRDRFKRGFEDRKSGKSFKDAYSARKLPPGGSAVAGLEEGAAKGAAEGLAKEGAKDVAAAAAETAAKEGVKGTAKAASKTSPIGLLTDIDAKGAYKAAKDLKNLKVVSAAKGVTQSAAVTLFRVSYDPWVIGFTAGLSLIVTLIVGSVTFFMSSSSMTFLERLLVVALWLLLLLIVLLVLGLILIGVCNGPTGWGIWAASWVSKTAADINKFCEPIGALQAATKNIAR